MDAVNINCVKHEVLDGTYIILYIQVHLTTNMYLLVGELYFTKESKRSSLVTHRPSLQLGASGTEANLRTYVYVRNRRLASFA